MGGCKQHKFYMKALIGGHKPLCWYKGQAIKIGTVLSNVSAAVVHFQEKPLENLCFLPSYVMNKGKSL